MIIEVCVDSVLSASNAVAGGVSRIELCGNLGIGGGTTPSLGLLTSVQRVVPSHIPIMAMIRPRIGDFLYSDDEFNVMLEDLRIFKRYGVAGIVGGFLNADGGIDLKRTASFARESQPLEFCFHRAFDMSRDGVEALDGLSGIPGVTRILTSGLGFSAPRCLSTLKILFERSQSIKKENRITPTIMPGSGINATTVGAILEALLPLGLTDVHLSGGAWFDNGMVYRVDGMGMGAGGERDWDVWATQTTQVQLVKELVDEATRRDYTEVENV